MSIVCLILCNIFGSARAQSSSEIRGVWITNIDSDVLFDPRRLSSAIQELADLNFNTLYPTIWNWGYTLYPSLVAKQTLGAAFDPRPLGLEGRDPLAEIVRQGHQRGMAVIPWFEFGLMAPEDSALAIRHRDWQTQRADGSVVWQQGIYPRVWLNLFKPEVQDFILSLILETVSNYDIDGIQFDDHFGLMHEFGYDDFTVKLYQQDHQGQSPPSDPKNPEWKRWRADRINQFMGRIVKEVKARKPKVLISVAPNPYPFSYDFSLQDWPTWQQNGWIDELLVQIYRTDLQAFSKELASPELQSAKQRIPTAIGILTGLKNKTTPIQQIQDQVQTARNQGFAGVSFFFYETLWNLTSEPASDRKARIRTLFSPPAPRPR